MAFVDKGRTTIGGMPDLNGAIIAARGDTFAIGGPGHRIYCTGMTLVGKGRTAIGGIPDLNGIISTARSDTFPIRGPGDRSHCTGMTLVGIRDYTSLIGR